MLRPPPQAVYALFIDRGQRNLQREREAIRKLQCTVGVRAVLHASIDMSDYRRRICKQFVREYGHIGRNLIMLSIAVPYSVAVNADAIVLGVTRTDGFSDTTSRVRKHFQHVVHQIFDWRNESLRSRMPRVLFPYVTAGWDKKDVIRWAHQEAKCLPLEQTWSCWDSGELHCGHCPACQSRRSAFRDAGVEDRTGYLS